MIYKLLALKTLKMEQVDIFTKLFHRGLALRTINQEYKDRFTELINRSGVAGAVLQTASSLSD